MPPKMTPRRRELLLSIHRLSLKNAGVSIAELAGEHGVSRARVSEHLGALRSMGLVAPPDGKHGSVHLTESGRAALGVGIPVYGEIAAGPPGFADQTPDRAVQHLEDLLGSREGDFLLQVRGESMTGLGILPGDYVLIRPTSEVMDGEVAVVLLPGDNAATLKRLFRQGDSVLLCSENSAFPPMRFLAAEIAVQGRMLGLIGMSRPRMTRPADCSPGEE